MQNKLLLCLFGLIAITPSCTTPGKVGAVNPTRVGLRFERHDAETDFEEYDGEDTYRFKNERDSTVLSVDAGHRVMPNLEIGGLLTRESSGGFTSEETLLIGPQARYYFVHEGNIQPWASLSVGIARYDAQSRDEYGSVSLDGDGTYHRLGLGVSYYPSPWVSIEGEVAYRKMSGDGSINYNDTSAGFGYSDSNNLDIEDEDVSLNLGISVSF